MLFFGLIKINFIAVEEEPPFGSFCRHLSYLFHPFAVKNYDLTIKLESLHRLYVEIFLGDEGI